MYYHKPINSFHEIVRTFNFFLVLLLHIMDVFSLFHSIFFTTVKNFKTLAVSGTKPRIACLTLVVVAHRALAC